MNEETQPVISEELKQVGFQPSITDMGDEKKREDYNNNAKPYGFKVIDIEKRKSEDKKRIAKWCIGGFLIGILILAGTLYWLATEDYLGVALVCGNVTYTEAPCNATATADCQECQSCGDCILEFPKELKIITEVEE